MSNNLPFHLGVPLHNTDLVTQLLPEVILQLEKDAGIVGISLELSPFMLEDVFVLRDQLGEILETNHNLRWNNIVPLLYRVDIPENIIKMLNQQTPISGKKIAELLIIRTLQKVWYRHFYSSD